MPLKTQISLTGQIKFKGGSLDGEEAFNVVYGIRRINNGPSSFVRNAPAGLGVGLIKDAFRNPVQNDPETLINQLEEELILVNQIFKALGLIT